MQTEENPCYEAFLSAFDIISRMRKSGASVRPVRVVNDLIPFVERELGRTCPGFKIRLSFKKWPGDQIFGALLRYHNGATIIYSAELNTCWRRFVIAKELAHLIFDDSRTFTKNPVELIGTLLSGIDPASGANAALTSEKLAAIMAVELLLPHVERARVVQMKSQGDSPLRIGSTYRVPAKVVETFLSADYERIANDCWNLVPK